MATSMVNSIEFAEIVGEGETTPAVGERLDLVGHVKIRLTVALGSAEVTIDKLFSLGVNDVIGLDRSVDAPVDIRVNDKVIARGALVAVGDNFGVRITEVQPET